MVHIVCGRGFWRAKNSFGTQYVYILLGVRRLGVVAKIGIEYSGVDLGFGPYSLLLRYKMFEYWQ
jgi:hypothetical protein